MRNEDYTMPLFLAVGFITAATAGAVAVFDTKPYPPPEPAAEMARLEPVRVVGTPFVPNTKPSER